MTQSTLPPNPSAIKKIFVEKLFGYLDYQIPEIEDGPTRSDRLIIIYGDNGSGKTTLLRLVFALLSPSGGGRKTFIAETPFQSLRVMLTNGVTVAVHKPASVLTGGYTVLVTTPLGGEAKFQVLTNQKGAVDEDLSQLDKEISQLDTRLYFLPDDRRVQTIPSGPTEEREERTRLVLQDYLVDPMVWHTREPREASHHLQVKPVLGRLFNHIRQHVLAGSREGEETAASIYLRVVEQLTHLESASTAQEDTQELVARIQELAARTQDFAQYGIVSVFPGEKFLPVIARAPVGLRKPIQDMIDPYLSGIEARLNVLEGIKKVVADYATIMNSFLHNKAVKFSVQSGFTFHSSFGGPLDPDVLSSGEKQLVLLMSNTILARDTSGIFLIDEPEMSLNIKWQRELVTALLNCARDSNIQYVLATHSIELITQYRANATRLVSDFPPHG